ncbi:MULTISPECIES: helix-turn-helix domain-containing protein [unclassified Embleya]|uniref:helix-turn-helix domain-containing protein n=1 Tax=unclassified Embleya TaxID=2699296 RepID=UPI0036C6EA9F
MARLVRDAALGAGVAHSELAHLPGLEPETLADPLLRVPTATLVRLWELVAHGSPAGAGVRAAETAAQGRLHVWDYLFTTGGTFADGCRDAARYLPTMTDPGAEMTVIEEDRRLTITYGIAPYSPAAVTVIDEFAMALMLRRARDARGPGVVPVHVALAHEAPKNHRHLIEAFGTRAIDFGARTNSVTFLDLDTEPPRPAGPNDELALILRRYADNVLENARPAAGWHGRFRSEVAQALGEELSLELVAQRMAMSPRTLQRRLSDLETTWRDEIESVRHERAGTLLRETDLPVQSIAGRLGYTDARALRRAFHRWTGQTPDAYRRTPTPHT